VSSDADMALRSQVVDLIFFWCNIQLDPIFTCLTMQQIRTAKVDESTKLLRAFKDKMPNTGSY
jgi:hypothetical protein